MRFARGLFISAIGLLLLYRVGGPLIDGIFGSYPVENTYFAGTAPPPNFVGGGYPSSAGDQGGLTSPASPGSLPPGGDPSSEERTLYRDRHFPEYDKEALDHIMRILLSIIFLGSGLFVILSSRFKEESKKWAYATVGTIIGFWFGG